MKCSAPCGARVASDAREDLVMFSDLNRVIDQVVKDKGITREVIVDALESAMLTAARKTFGPYLDIEANFNEEVGEVELFQFLSVVEAVADNNREITLGDAHKHDPEAQYEDELGLKMDTSKFGRIAAQTAKQVIIQKVRDAERENVYNEFKDRVGEIINAIVQRFEKGSIIVNLGHAEAILTPRDQIPREYYRQGERLRGLIVSVDRIAKGPQITLSRASEDFVKKLFETEVPEIADGIVRIVGIAREPGSRTKVAVYSEDSDVDPVGACVGMRGSRVQSVVQELRGEKIDIVAYTPDLFRYACQALAPAQITEVSVDEDDQLLDIIVPDDQLSLAIGRKGQNVRLASKLLGWHIDIKSESRAREMLERTINILCQVEGVDFVTAGLFFQSGMENVVDLSQSRVEELAQLEGMSEERAQRLIEAAAAFAKKEPEKALGEGLDTDKEADEAAEAQSADQAGEAAETGAETAPGDGAQAAEAAEAAEPAEEPETGASEGAVPDAEAEETAPAPSAEAGDEGEQAPDEEEAPREAAEGAAEAEEKTENAEAAANEAEAEKAVSQAQNHATGEDGQVE